MLETVYAPSFSSALLRRKPELAAYTPRGQRHLDLYSIPQSSSRGSTGLEGMSEVCQARIGQWLGHKTGHFSATLRE